MELAEAGRADRQLPAILVIRTDEREDDEAAEEGDVGAAAVREEVERAEQAERHRERMTRDPVHAGRTRLARTDPASAPA